MIIEAGKLACVRLQFVRLARHRSRHQARSHRAPNYLVRYQLEGVAAREAWADPPTKPQLIWRIRSSRPRDCVMVELTSDGNAIVGWTNRTLDTLLNELGDTWGETD
ncbi:hypothetical protein AB3X91_07590 [Paraburkholderia sp. BR14263]|uniref:DUF3024 domain-containing protein n=1 Tax=Paraburkholderia guartelaensis TaxID=2546446 RepID=A0ABU9SHF5_9BURK